MVNTHSQSFFGQTTGMTIRSPSREEPYIFINCIKKKSDNSWEKPSRGEGKTIRISIEEMAMILEVLNNRKKEWSGYHTYKNNNTQISFAWENGAGDKLWINIGEYSKMLAFGQIEILRRYLEHLLDEKIVHATISNFTSQNSSGKTHQVQHSDDMNVEELDFDEFMEPEPSSSSQNSHYNPPSNPIAPSNTNNKKMFKSSQSTGKPKKKQATVSGVLKSETPKAILVNLPSGEEMWFPKSTVHSPIQPNNAISQDFLIDAWILKKNKII